MRTRFLKIAVAIPIAGAILYTAAWLTLALTTLRQAEHWVSGQQSRGAQIAHGEALFTGFPAPPVVNFPSFSMTLPPDEGGWRWQSPNVALSVVPWAPHELAFKISGDQILSGPWPQGSGPLRVSAQNATAKVHIDSSGGVNGVRVDGDGVVVAWSNKESSLLQADRTSADVAVLAGAQPAFSLAVEADNFVFAARVPDPLARTVRRFRMKSEVEGPVSAGSLPKVLENWRAAGGVLELRELYVDWPPLTIAGSGTAALDEALQPIGAFTFKFGGFFAAVDAMTAAGLVKPADASLARIVLGLMAKRPADGGPPELGLALTIEDRKLLAGPVTLMEMPAVTWPGNVVVP